MICRKNLPFIYNLLIINTSEWFIRNNQINKEIKMFNRLVVYEALNRSMTSDTGGNTPGNPVPGQDTLISQLIHDIFGGEILKTRLKKGWHFYNRIEGARIDFTSNDIYKSSDNNQFEDIPSSPDETHHYFEDEEYSTFLMRFIWAFEEAVGLDKYRHGLSA